FAFAAFGATQPRIDEQNRGVEVDLMSYRPFMRLDILVPLAPAAVDPKALAAVGDAASVVCSVARWNALCSRCHSRGGKPRRPVRSRKVKFDGWRMQLHVGTFASVGAIGLIHEILRKHASYVMLRVAHISHGETIHGR